MLKSIVQYINTRLLTTGYFNNLYELVELKPQRVGSAPMVYCTGGEYKDINTEKNTSYVRLLRAISITESSKVYRSGETVFNVTIPLRVVGLVRNVNEDDSYKAVNLAGDICKVVSESSMLASIVNARTIDFIPTSLLVNTQELYRQEFPGTEKEDARYEYTMAGVDFNVIIDITQECWELACGDTTTDCSVLLASLTTQEKNECILPSYDFSDPVVQNSLTHAQVLQINTWLFPGASLDVTINGATWETIPCGLNEEIPVINTLNTPLGSKIGTNWVIPDTTFNVYVGGILQSTITEPTLENTVININL